MLSHSFYKNSVPTQGLGCKFVIVDAKVIQRGHSIGIATTGFIFAAYPVSVTQPPTVITIFVFKRLC